MALITQADSVCGDERLFFASKFLLKVIEATFENFRRKQ